MKYLPVGLIFVLFEPLTYIIKQTIKTDKRNIFNMMGKEKYTNECILSFIFCFLIHGFELHLQKEC
jgi:hypothetical protein